MAITINWATKVISVPKADMTLIQSNPTEIRELNLNNFRLTLKDLEDDEAGMAFLLTHTHSPPVTVGGVTLARVVEIINGYTVTFEDGQYAVNLVGANSNVADVTNVNQVSVRSQNSAGLVESATIQFSSFAGMVAIDPTSSTIGTTFPAGTLQKPVNNLADAVLIADTRGLNSFLIMDDLTLSNVNVSGRQFHGLSQNVGLTLGANVTTAECEFNTLSLTGTISGANSRIANCSADSISFGGAILEHCALRGVIAFTGSSPIILLHCYDADPSTATVEFSFSSYTGTEFAIRDWFGGVKFKNLSNATTNIAIDMRGRLLLENTLTAGTIVARGIGHTEGATGGTTVTTEDLITNASIADTTWDELRSGHAIAGSFGEGVGVATLGGSTTAVARLKESAQTMLLGIVDDTVLAPTTITFDSDLVLPYTNHVTGRAVFWRTGTLDFHATRIVSYLVVNGRGRFVVDVMPAAPADGDVFVVV